MRPIAFYAVEFARLACIAALVVFEAHILGVV